MVMKEKNSPSVPLLSTLLYYTVLRSSFDWSLELKKALKGKNEKSVDCTVHV